jgi:hypothetical protein
MSTIATRRPAAGGGRVQREARLQTAAGTDAPWFTDSPELLRYAVQFLTR